MNCKKIQALILTDYSDDQLNDRQKESVEQHLIACPECKKFSSAIAKAAAELFNNVPKATPPEYMWRRIKESIMAERYTKTTFAASFLERFKSVFYFPKPALALTTALMLLLVFGIVTKLMVNKQDALKANMQERVGYFEYVGAVTTNSFGGDDTGYGTVIEEYFL